MSSYCPSSLVGGEVTVWIQEIYIYTLNTLLYLNIETDLMEEITVRNSSQVLRKKLDRIGLSMYVHIFYITYLPATENEH